MLLHRTRIHTVTQLHRQGKHIDILRQSRQLEVMIEQLVHQVAQFDVVLTVSLSDLGQTMLSKDQLPSGGVFVVDLQHPLLDQSRQITPVTQSFVIDRRLQAGAKRRMHVGGQRFEQCRDAGEEVIHG